MARFTEDVSRAVGLRGARSALPCLRRKEEQIRAWFKSVASAVNCLSKGFDNLLKLDGLRQSAYVHVLRLNVTHY